MFSLKTDHQRFFVLVALLLSVLLLVGFNTFSKPKGFDSEGLEKIEALTRSFNNFSERSAKMIQEVNMNNRLLNDYINVRASERRTVYDEMMREYLTGTDIGDLNDFEIRINPDSGTAPPPTN